MSAYKLQTLKETSVGDAEIVSRLPLQGGWSCYTLYMIKAENLKLSGGIRKVVSVGLLRERHLQVLIKCGSSVCNMLEIRVGLL